MAASDLRELRARITVEADITLDRIGREKGIDRSEIVRGILHEWALEQRRIAFSIVEAYEREGITAAPERRDSGVRKHRAAAGHGNGTKGRDDGPLI